MFAFALIAVARVVAIVVVVCGEEVALTPLTPPEKPRESPPEKFWAASPLFFVFATP